MNRTVLALSLAIALSSPLSASAHEPPLPGELAANAKCREIGDRLDRHGLTQGEIRYATKRHCVKIFNGEWFSTDYEIDVVG